MHWTKTSVVVVVAGLLLGLPAVVAAQRPTEGVGGGGGGGAATSRGGETGGGSGASGGSTSPGASGPIAGPGGYSTPTGSSASGGGGSYGSSSNPGSTGWRGADGIRPRDEIYQRPGFADVFGKNGGAGRNEAAAPEVPWYSRPRGDAPALGNAMPRTDYIASRPPGGGGGGGGNPGSGDGGYYPGWGDSSGYGLPRYGYGYGWYMYPGMWSSYGYGYPDCGYGAYGMGYFFYNPFAWTYYGNCGYYGGLGAAFYGAQYGTTGPDYSGGGGSMGYGSYQSRGGLRLKVKPTNARVYVDGYFAGKVDQFDGSRQKLEIERGKHKIEISALGYTPVVFEIEIKAYETIIWEGNLEMIIEKIK